MAGPPSLFEGMESLNEIIKNKQIFFDAFEKIDPANYGDVDQREWIQALQRLDVDLEESDLIKLFKNINLDTTGYIDRQVII